MSSSYRSESVRVWVDTVAVETQKTDRQQSGLQPLSSSAINSRPGKRKLELQPARHNPPRDCKRAKTMARPSAQPRGRRSGRARAFRSDNILSGRGRGQRSEIVDRKGRELAREKGEGKECAEGESSEGEQVLRPVPSDIFEPPTTASRGPSRPGSPSKRSKTLDKPKSDKSIDLQYLGACTPSVLVEFRAKTFENEAIPAMVKGLEDALSPEGVIGFIPTSLKPLYDTEAAAPQNSQRALPQHAYLPSSDEHIPTAFRHSLKATVEQVVEAANRNDQEGATEHQWKLRMMRPDGACLEDETNTKVSTADTTAVTASRMIDISLGLKLDASQTSVINKAWRTRRDNEHSLNQSLSYVRVHPLFLDIELKKQRQVRDPLVQLGIWMAACYEKRKLHGWDVSIPMPGLVIDGSEWKLYIGYIRDDDVGNTPSGLKIMF
ncbi:MAG: hypothetical protein Q9219_006544 [cf. Caloplaca sp. 3 TL-2023]